MVEEATRSSILVQDKRATVPESETERLGFHHSCQFPSLPLELPSLGARVVIPLGLSSPPGDPRLSKALGTRRSSWELRNSEAGLLPSTPSPPPPGYFPSCELFLLLLQDLGMSSSSSPKAETWGGGEGT